MNPLNTSNTDSIAQLRDIHMPPAISIWPLAPGWWMLLSILLYSALLFLFWKHRHWLRNRARYQALQQLALLKEQSSLNPVECLMTLSAILRRVALAYFPRRTVASLHGLAWLQFLDRTSHSDAFTCGVGQQLARGPYQASFSEDLSPLIVLVESWVEKLRISK